MPNLDEFGREIPAPTKSGTPYSSLPPRKHHRHQQHHHRHNPHHTNKHHHHHDSQPDRRGPPPKKKSEQHPSLIYVSEPLLCEYVWKDQKESSTQNDDTTETYETYRKAYCLNFIRAFFNQHMDDTWFRQRYSAALRRQAKRRENQRAVEEARLFIQTIQTPHQVCLTAENLSGHFFSCQQKESPVQAWVVSNIPSNLTDEQLLLAICKDDKKKAETITTWPVYQSKAPYLERSVCIVGPAEMASEITKPSSSTVVDNDAMVQDGTIELHVACSSDPYNRTDYDADGHGGATADGLRVPERKATVRIKRIHSPTRIIPLSNALSSPTRYTKDREKAVELAAQLDAKANIPVESRLASMLDGAAKDWSVVDQLDTAIAYLRRIHLRFFYRDVESTDISFGDMLVLQNVLYVRIKNAPDDEAPDDLLVQTLDQSIAKALAPSDEGDPDLDKEADLIEEAMCQTEQKWLRDHNIPDDRGRARCSFHFCKKLFQDSSFLHKHLYKKHGEFLVAEQAKCHDESMMKTWDAVSTRPVPELLVECGAKFGQRSTPLQSGVIPDVIDPEPALFRKDEEEQQRIAAQSKRREEMRERKPRPVGGGFVDVDDMKEEKIELPMDAVAAAVPVKKKKKKRKLL